MWKNYFVNSRSLSLLHCCLPASVTLTRELRNGSVSQHRQSGSGHFLCIPFTAPQSLKSRSTIFSFPAETVFLSSGQFPKGGSVAETCSCMHAATQVPSGINLLLESWSQRAYSSFILEKYVKM